MYSKCQMYDVNWTRVYQVRDENKIFIFATFIVKKKIVCEIATKTQKTLGENMKFFFLQKYEIVRNNIFDLDDNFCL